MGKPSVPEAPDYSDLAAASEAAAEMSYQIAQDQLAWAQEQYDQGLAITEPTIEAMTQTLDFANATAEADRARYEEVYQPLEDQLIQEAADYASPQRLELEMGRAQAGVAQQYEASRQAAEQQLESYGLNPADTRYAALDIDTRTDQAAVAAAAGEQAYQQTQAKADALRSEALNIGKGYPGQISTAYNTATQAGTQAVAGTNQTLQTGSTAMTQPSTYMSTGTQALDTWGNTMTQDYNAQMAQYNAQMASSSGISSALGSITGMVMPFVYSSTGVTPHYQEGGEVHRYPYAPGGPVPPQQSPSRGATPDDVPAQLTAGEFVMPEDVVRWKGSEYFYKEVEKARQKRVEMATPGGAPMPQGAVPAGGGGRPAVGGGAPPQARPSMGHQPMARPTLPQQPLSRPPLPQQPLSRPVVPGGQAVPYQRGGYVQALPAAPVRMQLGGTPTWDPAYANMGGVYQLPNGVWVGPDGRPLAGGPTGAPAPVAPVPASASAAAPTPMVPASAVNQPAYPNSYPNQTTANTTAPWNNYAQPRPTSNMYTPATPAATPGSAFAAGVQQPFAPSAGAPSAGWSAAQVPPPNAGWSAAQGNYPNPGFSALQQPVRPAAGWSGLQRPPGPFGVAEPTGSAPPARTPRPRPSGGSTGTTARKPKPRPGGSKAKSKTKKREPIIKENPPYSMSAFEFARQGQDYLNRNKPRRSKRPAVDVFNAQAGYPSARSK